MSLSYHIKSPSSPVRAWLEANLPETRRLATEANRELRRGAKTCPTPPVPGADPGLVGTAVDYLLRACLRATSIERTVASRAVQQLGGESPIGRRAIEVESEAVRAIRKLRPSARDLTGDEWSRLCRGCLALARLEQLFRAGPMNPAIFRFVIDPLSFAARHCQPERALATGRLCARRYSRSLRDQGGRHIGPALALRDHLGARGLPRQAGARASGHARGAWSGQGEAGRDRYRAATSRIRRGDAKATGTQNDKKPARGQVGKVLAGNDYAGFFAKSIQ